MNQNAKETTRSASSNTKGPAPVERTTLIDVGPAPTGPQKGGGKKRRLRRLVRWPSVTVDLNQPKHRRNFFLGLIGLVATGIALLAGGLQTYQYTESAEFCGSLCHPMKSEFIRYERSPHANVDCAKCHIGPGTSFFVKSKIDGLKQVYAVLANTYSRPIKSPVHDLRPARETCEECHTPTSFKDNIIKTIGHYDNDEPNTPVRSTLILKMGGWQETTGVSEGIHWHITNKIYYITADAQRQVVLWVGVEQPDGSLKEFFARDMLNMAWTSFVEEAREKDEIRLMDCIDCHNRTAHYIPSPEEMVDEAISTGQIAADLPFVRTKAVEVLSSPYPNRVEAQEAIDGLADFYRVGYADIFAARRPELEITLEKLKEIYAGTNFPDMGVNWQTNPNNARHRPSLGCFRCHDGKHVSVDPTGNEVETISVKCNLCHTVPIIGRGTDMLVEAPVIVGSVPSSHSDFRWTIEHRSVTEAELPACYDCHGQGFCNNGVCHSLSHPPDMLFTHAEEYRKTGNQVCYTCHQDILCSRCHPGGIITNP
ncbi:MAG: cytochrome c3 family protein [Anaerolineae bacterium]